MAAVAELGSLGGITRMSLLTTLKELFAPKRYALTEFGIGDIPFFLALLRACPDGSRLTFHQSGDLDVEACPYHILGHTPIPFGGKTRAAQEHLFVSHLRRLSMATGGSQVGEPGPDGCLPLSPPKRAGR